jgi:hypothetical protein
MRLAAILLLTIFFLATLPSANQSCPGRLVTPDHTGIIFDSIIERDIFKGW